MNLIDQDYVLIEGAGLFTVACPAPAYDAAPLVAAWR